MIGKFCHKWPDTNLKLDIFGYSLPATINFRATCHLKEKYSYTFS